MKTSTKTTVRIVSSIFIVFFDFAGFSQNKKEQIELLNFKIDSCNSVINAQILQINQFKQDLDELKLSESKVKETLQTRENQLKASEGKYNSLLIENNALKEKIKLLENPPLNLNGNYTSGDDLGFSFNLTIYDESDKGFNFKYETFCRKAGYEFGSSGEGRAILLLSNTFISQGDVLDESSEENIQIQFVKTSAGLEINITTLSDGDGEALCWKPDRPFSMTKTD